VNPVSAVEVEAEEDTVAEQASSLTMPPDHLEEDAGRAPRRNCLQNGLCYTPCCSEIEKNVLYAIYSRQAQDASLTAADRQLVERRGGDCEYVEPFAEPPASDDQSILPVGAMEPGLSGTVDTLESNECESGILLADEERISEYRWEWFTSICIPPALTQN
jgi:hypothetical protein